MSLHNGTQMIVLVLFGTLVLVLTLAALRSIPLFQPGGRVVVAFCTAALSVIGLHGLADSDVTYAGASSGNGLIAGILYLYAALGVAMLIVMILTLLRRGHSGAARRNSLQGRIGPRPARTVLTTDPEGLNRGFPDRWTKPVPDRSAAGLTRRDGSGSGEGIIRGLSKRLCRRESPHE